MSTDNLDLAELRREYRHVPEIVALLDRIEALEAERDELAQAVEMGEAISDVGGYRVLYENQARVADVLSRSLDRAEARLARLTDDSMAEQIARALDPNAWWQESAEYPTMTRDEWEAAQDYALDQAARALAAIRAAAADDSADRTVYDEVRAERHRQIERGYDAKHDDEHGIDHLTGWAQSYVARDTGRVGLVKAAALMVAAIEAHDRAVAADEEYDPTNPDHVAQVEVLADAITEAGFDLPEEATTGE